MRSDRRPSTEATCNWNDAPEADTLVLIYSLTDSSYDDYTKYAIWLGRPVAQQAMGLRGYRPEQYPSAAG
jgi:aromatic ring-cleaving dioxygenase